MIIFGTRGITYKFHSGRFHCPKCGPDAAYTHRRVRRFFTLYFIPLIPLDEVDDFVVCDRCGTNYNSIVLSRDPAVPSSTFTDTFHGVLRRVLIKTLVTEPTITDEQYIVIRDVWRKVIHTPLSHDTVRADAAEVGRDGKELHEYVGAIKGQLTDRGKELVIQAALLVASADGALSDEGRLKLLRMGEAMEMTEAHLLDVMVDATRTSPS